MKIDRALELMCKALYYGVTSSIEGEEVIFRLQSNPAAIKTLHKSVIENAINDLDLYEQHENGQIFKGNVAEFLVSISGNARYGLLSKKLEVSDEVGGYEYRLGRPSLAFGLYMADKMFSLKQDVGRSLPFNSSSFHRHFEDADEEIAETFISSLRLMSLKIESESPTTRGVFQNLADSFYFHVGYNLDYPVIPITTLHQNLSRRPLRSQRRRTATELDAPHRSYIPDLVHNYQLALSTESPMLAYLSYYHVAEYWFEDVFQNDIALKLQSVITAPGFSYRRMNDLRRLIKIVSDNLKTRDDEVVINEQSALKMTLMRYVVIEELVNSLDSFDSTLVDYYASGPVDFSGGSAVNLREPANEKLFGKLASRLYKNRNALVHRKNGAKSRFTPFKDDATLEPEVPMMRFIAEQIIISSARV